MKFKTEFENADTGECKTITAALTAAEVRAVQKLREDAHAEADLHAQAYALRHAYNEVPNGFLHSKPPEMVVVQ